jgi:hypothetical protein
MTVPLQLPSVDRTRELMHRDEASARTELLLRLLYSSTAAGTAFQALRDPAAEVADTTAAVLRTVDERALAVERAARLRNLQRQFERACPPLRGCLPAGVLARQVQDYADSDAFWRPVGTTLFENFCLFAHAAVRERSQLWADVLQLFGLVARFSTQELIAPPPEVCACTSGLPGAAPDPAAAPASPWDSGGLVAPDIPGALQVEIFPSAWRLVDDRGRLPTSLEPEAIGTEGSYQIVVAAFPGGKVTAATLLPLRG